MFRSKFIPRINITSITSSTIYSLSNKLSSIKSRRSPCVFVDFAGVSQSLTQCENAVREIKTFSKEHKEVPVFTFGNEIVSGTMLLPLLAGDKCFVDPNTMLGPFDFVIKKTLVAGWIQERNYQIKLNTAGEHKIRLNPLEQIKDIDKEWALNLLKKQKELFLDSVYELRKDKLKVKRNDLKDYLNSTFLNSKVALDIGLIDGFHSIDTLRFEMFPGLRIRNAEVSLIKSLKGIQSSKEIEVQNLLGSVLDNNHEIALQLFAECSLRNDLL